jgi:hypothetical protein
MTPSKPFEKSAISFTSFYDCDGIIHREEVIMKHSRKTLYLGMLCLWASSTAHTSPKVLPKKSTPKLPAYVSTGSQWGVMSPDPKANQTGALWLKQKGTVWDAALAILFDAWVRNPEVVSLQSDVSLMTYKKGSNPSFSWLSYKPLKKPDPKKTFSNSSWLNHLLSSHQKNSKFPIHQLVSLPKSQAKPPLSKIFSQIPFYKPTKTTETGVYPNIELQSTILYASDTLLLGALQSSTEALLSKDNLTPKNLATYLKSTPFPHLKPAYNKTFGFVLFDRYGTVLAINCGIPLTTSTQQARSWTLSPLVGIKNKMLLFVLNPHGIQPTSYLQSFPINLYRLFSFKHTLVETFDSPQFWLTKDKTLSMTHAHKLFINYFEKTKQIEPPNTFSGFEVWPTTVVGFTPHTSQVKPILE